MKGHTSRITGALALASFGFAQDPCAAQAPQGRTCSMTFKVYGYGINSDPQYPDGITLFVTKRFFDFGQVVNVKLPDINKQLEDEAKKYVRGGYARIGPPTMTEDCAGYVMDNMWKTGKYVVTAPRFYEKVLKPFGERIPWEKAEKGDIVMYGEGGHFALVVRGGGPGAGPENTTIRSKDGNESVYETMAAKKVGVVYDREDALWRAYGKPILFRARFVKINTLFGFEDGLAYPWGTGQYAQGHSIWWNSGRCQSVARADPQKPHSGQMSLHIVNPTPMEPGTYGTTQQEVSILPAKKYRVRMWARANNLASASAVQIIVDKEWRVRPISLPRGTFDWTLFTGVFTLPTNVVDLRIICQDRGEVWIDDIEIESIH